MKTSFEPYEGAEPYIFVSYAHKDAEQVIPLLNALNLAGYRVWYDNGIQAGKRWADSLAEHIIGCAVFMPFISPAFADSVNCYDEAAYARTKSREIFPVYLEERVALPPGLDMAFHPIQWRKLSDYNGNANRFIRSLENEDILKPCHRTNDAEKASASVQEYPEIEPLSDNVDAWHPKERHEDEEEQPTDKTPLNQNAWILIVVLLLCVIIVTTYKLWFPFVSSLFSALISTLFLMFLGFFIFSLLFP